MKKVLTVLSFLFLLNQAESQVTQEWASRYNGPPGNNSDFSYAMTVDGSGNVYVTGHSVGIGTGSYDCATIKYNSSGIEQWARRYNGTANSTDYAYAIAVDGLGNVFVTGASVGAVTGNYDLITIKYDASGVLQWVRSIDYGWGHSIAVDGLGNIYVTGETLENGSNNYTTIKYNTSGVQLWISKYNGTGNSINIAYSLALDGSGNVYVTGESANGGYYDYATVKYNSSGVQQWESRYSGPPVNGHDNANTIKVDQSGNVYVTGKSAGISSNYDYATIKYNSSGDSVWVKRYDGPGNAGDVATSLALDGSGNVYVTGYSSRFVANFDYATIKYNSSGDTLWVKRYNGSGNYTDYANSIAVDAAANVYVTGYSRETVGSDNFTTIKYNTSGVQQWLASYSAGTNGEECRSVAVDILGNVYVTGYSATGSTAWDYATIKYSQTGSLKALNLTAFIEGFYDQVSDSMIPDTASVYLKNISSPYNTVDSSKGILSSSGAGTFLFANAVNGVNYYLAVKHRNSIETWSSSGNVFSSGFSTYNFSTNSSFAFGSNEKQVDASPVRFGIYSGDENQDGSIDVTDVVDIYNDLNNTGYVATDISGDGFVDVADLLIAYNNAINIVSVITP